MSQEKRFNARDRSYSAWHRRLSTRRFIGIEDAQLLTMIDLDASLYVEYDDGDKEPLALIETARDVGQSCKPATVTLRLARRADLPCYVVLYTLAEAKNPADPTWHDIAAFRVKRLNPPQMNGNWHVVTPESWCLHLRDLRRRVCTRLDESLDADGGAAKQASLWEVIAR